MTNNNIIKLLTRCQLPIPFGNKEEWERFANLFIPCFIFIDMFDEPAKYQKKILESILIGKGNLTIWTSFITLDENDERVKMNKAIKALVDGHMGIYGFPEKTFNSLEKTIEKYIENESKNGDSMVSTNGLKFYKYRVVTSLIDETTQSYNVSVELYQEPLKDVIYDDLVEFGIYSQDAILASSKPANKEEPPPYKSHEKKEEKKEKTLYETLLEASQMYDKKERENIKNEFNVDDIGVTIDDYSDDYDSNDSMDED